ncbi:MAG: transposase [Ignavibacteria bacterium]|nr:transposase [Ignavibacteria bacterium]
MRHATVRLRLKRIFEQTNGSYGSPRMTRVLRKEGEIITHKTVERLMRGGLACQPQAAIPSDDRFNAYLR